MTSGRFLEAELRSGLDDPSLRILSIEPVSGSTPSHGLLIYHVDGGIIGNNDASHKMVDVVEAGGAESTPGVQNLDLASGAVAFQSVCGITPNVQGNRGDRWDPWPGVGGATTFDPNSCAMLRKMSLVT